MLSVALVCLCGLNLISCVDDDESKSVENIRNAKAALLNAKAEWEKANAEACLLEATANAALTNAEAAYKQAQADKEGVEAEIAKATLAMDIEAAKLNAQAALERAKLQMLTDAGTYSQQLYGKYSSAVQDVYDYTVEKIAAQQDLLNAKYRLENFEVLAASQIAVVKQNIALSEAKIAEYQKMSDAGNEEIQTAYIAALAEKDRLYKEKTSADNAAALAFQRQGEAQTVLGNTSYSKAVDLFSAYPGAVITRINKTYEVKETGNAADGAEFTESASCFYLLPVGENEANKCIIDQEKVVKTAEAAFLDVDTTYTKLKAEEDKAFAVYDTARDNQAYRQAYEAARDAASGYYQTSGYAQKQQTQNDARTLLNELKEAKEALATYSTTYQPALDALKKEVDALAQARLTSSIKNYEANIADARVTALRTLVNNTSSVAALIALETAQLENYNNQLSQIALINPSDSTGYTQAQWEELVAMMEARVADLEGRIRKAQADADYYKSLIEAEAGNGEA